MKKAEDVGNSFTFGHLTDPHLTSLKHVHVQDLVNKRALGYFSWRYNRQHEYRRETLDALVLDLKAHNPDHIVVTGDLTQVGLPAEFQEARQWLDSLGPPSGVTVIPGNHEAYVSSPWERTLALWEPYLVSDTDGAQQASRADPSSIFPSLRIRGNVALIGLSSACPSLPFLAVGKVDPGQLQRFEQLMAELSVRDFFRVVLIHHPPVPGSIKWRKRLTNSKAVTKILSQYGAELVLHGHSHRMSRSVLGDHPLEIPVIGLPAGSRCDGPPDCRARYNLYQVTRSSSGWELSLSTHGFSPTDNTVVVEKNEHFSMREKRGSVQSH